MNPRRPLQALSALCALIPIAAIAAQPQFTPIAPQSLARVKAEGKLPGRAVAAQVHGEMRATLGADGKVRLDCVVAPGSAFPSQNRRAEPTPPTEAK